MFEMTEDQFREYQENSIGLCRKCKAERECCEPDARDYPCESCGKNAVYGVEELLIMGLIEISEFGDQELTED